MCKILSRIKTLADAEGISIGTIERTIGASRGVISKAIAKGTDIQSKWLELICEKFPKYSPVWLLTGQGAMLLESSDTPIIHSSVPEDHIDEKIFVDNPQKLSQNPVSSMVNTFLETIKQQAEEIGRLKARIEELERERPVPAYARSTSKETVDLWDLCLSMTSFAWSTPSATWIDLWDVHCGTLGDHRYTLPPLGFSSSPLA